MCEYLGLVITFHDDTCVQIVALLCVVMITGSGHIVGGRQMTQRDEEFHQVVTVLEHICDVNEVTKVTLIHSFIHSFISLLQQMSNAFAVTYD